MSKITHQLDVELDIELLSPMHIGAQRGEKEESLDLDSHQDSQKPSNLLPLERDFREQDRVLLRIPGSSLKGVLRTEVERLVASAWGTDAACNVGTEKQEERHPKGALCPVCSWFGYVSGKMDEKGKNAGQRSRLVVSDAQPVVDPPSEDGLVLDAEWIQKKAQTPINRFHQIPLPLQVETIPDRKHFRTVIKLENPQDWELTLLAFVLRKWVKEDIWFGGGNGRGLGRTKASVTQLIMYEYGVNQLQWMAPEWSEQEGTPWWGRVRHCVEFDGICSQLKHWGSWPLIRPGGEVL